ncbi:Uncharacterised protein [Mycobacterium tuberculosis]|nr:Uncharacterised protein [Mycobacterium tuberculosis]
MTSRATYRPSFAVSSVMRCFSSFAAGACRVAVAAAAPHPPSAGEVRAASASSVTYTSTDFAATLCPRLTE